MRYYIHIFNGSQLIADPDGGDFLDLDAAVAEGAQSARDLIAEELRAGRPMPKGWEVHIAGPEGATLKAISFADLLAVEQNAQSNARPSVGDFAVLYARVQASAAMSRSLTEEIQATVSDIRAQLRALASFKIG